METTLGKRIKASREAQKMTQEDLAERMFVSRQAVSKWETDLSRPDTENLIRLSELLGVDLQTLIGGATESEEPSNGRAAEPAESTEADSGAMESSESAETDGGATEEKRPHFMPPRAVLEGYHLVLLMVLAIFVTLFIIGFLLVASEQGPKGEPAAPPPTALQTALTERGSPAGAGYRSGPDSAPFEC